MITVPQLCKLLGEYPGAYGNAGTIDYYTKCFEAVGCLKVKVRDEPREASITWEGGPQIADMRLFMKDWQVAHVAFKLARFEPVGGS